MRIYTDIHASNLRPTIYVFGFVEQSQGHAYTYTHIYREQTRCHSCTYTYLYILKEREKAEVSPYATGNYMLGTNRS